MMMTKRQLGLTLQDHFKRIEQEQKAKERGPSFEALHELTLKLGLIQVACKMALEGVTRATVSQVVKRAEKEPGIGISVTPQDAGMIFSSLDIRTVTSRGGKRLVLDYQQLTAICKEAASDWDDLAPLAEEQRLHHQGLLDKLADIETRGKEIKEMQATIAELTRSASMLSSLQRELKNKEVELASLKEAGKRLDGLENECRDLEERLSRLPGLEEKKRELKETQAKVLREKARLDSDEQRIVGEKKRLVRRDKGLTLAKLDAEIAERLREIEALDSKLKEKRSLVARLFRKSVEEPN